MERCITPYDDNCDGSDNDCDTLVDVADTIDCELKVVIQSPGWPYFQWLPISNCNPTQGDLKSSTYFTNLSAVATAAGGGLAACVKLTIYLTDLANFATVNEVMAEYFAEPYPARAAVGVAALPKAVEVEMDAILGIS